MTRETKKNRVSVITIYEAIWHRYRGDGRVGTNNEGYYFRNSGALEATTKYMRGADFHSREVRPRKVVKVDKRVYEFASLVPENEIDIIKPSELENRTKETMALSIGNSRVAIIHTSPIKVRRK